MSSSMSAAAFDPGAAAIDLADDNRAFRRDQVAARLGDISVDSVDRLIDQGKLTTVEPRRRGKVTLIPAGSLRAYIYGGGK